MFHQQIVQGQLWKPCSQRGLDLLKVTASSSTGVSGIKFSKGLQNR